MTAFSYSSFQAPYDTYNISNYPPHSSVQARRPVPPPSESQVPSQSIPLDMPSHMHMQASEAKLAHRFLEGMPNLVFDVDAGERPSSLSESNVYYDVENAAQAHASVEQGLDQYLQLDAERAHRFLESMPNLVFENDVGQGFSSLGENNAAQGHTSVGQGLDQYLQFVESLPDLESGQYGFDDDGVLGGRDFGMFDQMSIWGERLPGGAHGMYEVRASVGDQVYNDFLRAMPRGFAGEEFLEGHDFAPQDGFAQDSHVSISAPVNQPAGVVQPALHRSSRLSVRNRGR
ncbi:hypothetical protein QFC21_006841 [Naganishia friedmannii]|uniref:Uncharacterized protein n=1 Tax=Naganishia friedmannii TaxID=89922 RepID=A0ACC2V0D5_9TREE|nr:hypothetical protein QFC21_006841 [Naganishia friedmannii]